MKKEKKITEEALTEVREKTSKKDLKEKVKNKQKQIKENIKKEKQELTDNIKSLSKERKETKDKDKKKEIKQEIKSVKKQRNEIGKKDTYLRDVKKEMSMVRWPSAKEVLKYSIASLAFVAFFALFFYGIDAIFALVKDLVS